MIVTGIGLLAATALQLARFGPYQNIVVDHQGDEAMISAYGDAHVVRLHGSEEQLLGCIAGIKSGKAVQCPFAHTGSLEFQPIGAGSYQFTFTDTLKVNVVDFVVDASGLEHALAAMNSAR
ncbi:MAG: hypothetical protein ABI843_13200 [Dokdonella sp.]